MMIRLLHILAAIACTVMSCSIASGNGMGTGLTRPESYRLRTADDSTAVSSPDSAILSAIGSKLQEYFKALEREPTEVKCTEADFIIGVCTDSLVRQAVTILTFRHFLDSPIMGDDAVAIHIYDRWIQDGTVKLKNEADLWSARLFAETNRQSLTGCKAPEITLRSPDGASVTLFGDLTGSHANPEDGPGKYRILYFYSTGCPQCKIETILLRNILENDDLPVDFYAIFTGRDREEWMRYTRLQMDIKTSRTRVFHLWDPHMESDFQIKYGILQTPGLFLVSPDGKITGRRLDAVTLEKLLKESLAPVEMEYGSAESSGFYDKLFQPFGDSIRCENITEIARHIEESAAGAGDTLLFKQMTGDLMYYLTNRRGAAYKCALDSLIHRQILSHPAWRTADDSLKVISFARILEDLLSKTREGSPVPGLKINGTLKRCSPDGTVVTKEGKFRLDKTGGKTNYIIFHTEGCPICKAEIAAADSLLSDGRENIRILLIDMDMLFSAYPDQAQALFDAFDLTSMPLIISTDRKGTVTGRYLSLVE